MKQIAICWKECVLGEFSEAIWKIFIQRIWIHLVECLNMLKVAILSRIWYENNESLNMVSKNMDIETIFWINIYEFFFNEFEMCCELFDCPILNWNQTGSEQHNSIKFRCSMVYLQLCRPILGSKIHHCHVWTIQRTWHVVSIVRTLSKDHIFAYYHRQSPVVN